MNEEKFFNFDAVIEIEKKKAYQQGRADAIEEMTEAADCDHADCFDCAFGTGEGCKLHAIILKEINNG